MPAPKRAQDNFEVVSGSIHEASEVLKAMASDTRLKILCALSEGGEMPVGQLAELTEELGLGGSMTGLAGVLSR